MDNWTCSCGGFMHTKECWHEQVRHSFTDCPSCAALRAEVEKLTRMWVETAEELKRLREAGEWVCEYADDFNSSNSSGNEIARWRHLEAELRRRAKEG
jgi:hypothetical protein